jgi:hypothetical protein
MNMAFNLGSLIDRWSRVAILGCVAYSCVLAAINLGDLGGAGAAEWVSAWGNVPLMFVFLVMCWPVITDRRLGVRRRLAYQLIFAAQILDLVASVGWGYSALTASETFGAWPDVVWLFYYPLVAGACGLLYFELGGRLDSTRSLVDFATMVVGFGALLWFTALAPLSGMSAAQFAENWSAASYGIGNGICIIAGAMVAMQVTDWRAERAVTWLLLALVAMLVADLLWVNAELGQAYELGAGIDLVYPVYYIFILLSVNAQRHERANSSTRGLQGDLRGSLPIVALMVGVVALLNDRLGLADAQSPLLMGVVLVATLLVVVSQALATREVVGLHREVATRRATPRTRDLRNE